MAVSGLERQSLARGVAKLEPLLAQRGFGWVWGDEGVASGGPFANGSFRRPGLSIGLIVRHRDQLGCPVYEMGDEHAGHDELLTELGAEGLAMLVPGEIVSFRARDGGDPFDALRMDLERLVLPVLGRSMSELRGAIDRAVARRLARFHPPTSEDA